MQSKSLQVPSRTIVRVASAESDSHQEARISAEDTLHPLHRNLRFGNLRSSASAAISYDAPAKRSYASAGRSVNLLAPDIMVRHDSTDSESSAAAPQSFPVLPSRMMPL